MANGGGGPTPPSEGFQFFLSWGVVEWILATTTTVGTGVALWVLRLAVRMEKQEDRLTNLQGELDKINLELKEMERKAEEDWRDLTEKLDALRDSLPDKTFVIQQLNYLQMRIDGMVDRKMNQVSQIVRESKG